MIEKIHTPADLKQLETPELSALADELRRIIIRRVAENGGHLASNCGSVELTVALHRVFNAPGDRVFFDVGHQSYAHKLLTGRSESFEKLRRYDGISGFPHPEESGFDPAPAGHAGSALPVASGFAAAEPDADGRLIVVIGDGSIGCGVNFEALNHLSHNPGKRRIVLIINDNQMSISRNVGGLSTYLNRVISGTFYNRVRYGVKRGLRRLPKVFSLLRSLVISAKGALLPRGNFFELLGLRYLGPVDGHDLPNLVRVLERIKAFDAPVVLHVVTQKGYGCSYAEDDPTRYHGIAGCDAETGKLPAGSRGFSRALGDALLKLAEDDPRVVAVTPAMIEGTGLSEFSRRYPERCFDVGIAEEHALSFCCGLAAAGKIPVCTFYDTFLQRALDQIYHDGVLAKVPLILAVDRAGVVEDGPTHHGIYNCGFLRSLPGITICAPARCKDVERFLKMAIKENHPVVIRYPRGSSPEDAPAELDVPVVPGKAAVIRKSPVDRAVIWSIGRELFTALACADILAGAGIAVTVVDARFLKPFDRALALELAMLPHFTIEDHCVVGGLFSALNEALSGVPHGVVRGFGWSDEELTGHGEIPKLRAHAGMTPEQIAGVISGALGETL